MPKRSNLLHPFRKISPMRESLRVVVPYVVLGGLWILFTDELLNLAADPAGMVRISIIKGLVYVAITAALIWTLVYSRVKELQTSQTELAESESRFRLLVEGAPDAVFVQTDYRFTYVNAKALTLFGAKSETELLGQPISQFVDKEMRAKVLEYARRTNDGVKPPIMEEVIRRLDGVRVDVEVAAVPIRYAGQPGGLVFMRDITERRQYERNQLRMELQLRQKHRLESVGTLASGIAHEINNPITGIINYAQLIFEHPAADDVLQEYSREIMTEGQRIADTVKNLLSFSQYNKQMHTMASVHGILESTISLIETVLQRDQIDLAVRVEDGIPPISCCVQQIRQVLMNLITNARDALNTRYAGYDENKKLMVSAGLIQRDGQPWICFAVEDRGVGIPEDLLPRIFDPFFTTSMRSEHSGLGLSICLGIVKEHHGDIRFETQPGEYTRAIVELPAEESALV